MASLRIRIARSTALVLAATPLVLGSFVAELFFPLACALFVVRLVAEERFLADKLPGYGAYMAKMRRRLVPGLW